MKHQLKARIEMAKFLQETTEAMADALAQSRCGDVGATAAELYDFMRRVRSGGAVSNEDIKRFAKLFNDELTLDTVDRVQVRSPRGAVRFSPLQSASVRFSPTPRGVDAPAPGLAALTRGAPPRRSW